MRNSAPSVSYPVGRSRLAARLLLGAWLLGALVFAGWCAQAGDAPRRTGLLALALLAAGAGGWQAARLGAGSRLRWDGAQWHAEGSIRLAGGEPTVHLDAGSLLLVRLRAPGGARAWLWAERAADPARWRALRRALYAHAPAAREPAAGAPPGGGWPP